MNNALSILKSSLIGQTKSLFLSDEGRWQTYDGFSSGQWFDCKIVDVVYVAAEIDSSDVFQAHPYYDIVFDNGFQMELPLD
jgi:hypothetical protein